MILQSVYKRELGVRPNITSSDDLHKTVYTSIKCHHKWQKNVHCGGVYNFAYSPNGSSVVAVCEQNCFLVLDPYNGKLIGSKMNAHLDCVNHVTFLDSRTFATCSDDMHVALWDLRYIKRSIRTLRGHTRWVKNVQYLESINRLMSSGFDGKIFLWNIDDYTDEHRQLAYSVDGLMRSCITPDENRLIVSTDAGYLMLVQNLDLEHINQDLDAFKSKKYNEYAEVGAHHGLGYGSFMNRLRSFRRASRHDSFIHRDLFTQTRNRLEIIHEYPTLSTDVHMITSLTVHPQGWVVMSRNTSANDDVEWTCVHDIQPRSPEIDNGEDDSATVPHTGSRRSTHVAQSTQSSTTPGTSSAAATRTSPHSGSSNLSDRKRKRLQDKLDRIRLKRGRWQETDNSHDSSSDSDTSSSESSDTSDDDDSDAVPNLHHMFNFSLPSNHFMSTLDTYGVLASHLARVTPPLPPHVLHPPSRITHYIDEPTAGRGYIKEACFAPDGRVIASPYKSGVRLLAFNSEVSELCDCVPQKFRSLYELLTDEPHAMSVFCTKFSPVHNILASGSQDGKIYFHQPVL